MTILRKYKRACSYRISFGTVLVAIRHLYATTLLIRYFFNVLVCMQFSCYPINNENTKIIFRDMWNVLIHLLYIRFELSRSHQVQWMYLQNCLQTFHKRNVSKNQCWPVQWHTCNGLCSIDTLFCKSICNHIRHIRGW